MKAIIEVARKGSAVRTAREQLVAAGQGRALDYRLSFESVKSLFADLTPARLVLLDTLRKAGPCSVYAFSLGVKMGSNRGRALGVIASLFGTEVGLFTAWQAANPTDPGFETGLFDGIAGLAIGVLCSAFGIFYNRASAA